MDLYHALHSLVPAPDTRLPLTLQTFVQLFLPPILLYYATAVLVMIPGRWSLTLRAGLLPFTLWSAFRASTRLDFASWAEDERFIYLNQGFLVTMSTLALRAVVWSFEVEPYQKLERETGKPRPTPLSWKTIYWDAWNLTFNLRGLQWNWSDQLFIPRDRRPLHSTPLFLKASAHSLIRGIVIFDSVLYAVQQFGPTTFATPEGGSIFDYDLPPLQRYWRSSVITFLTGFGILSGIEVGYLLCTIIGVGVLQNDPQDWPPAFDTPWAATSLNDFWTKRWHQSFREVFVGVGAKPLSLLFGKVGVVAGAFGVSGLLHVWGLWGMGRGTEFWSVAGYFLLMGFGIVLEQVYRGVTGKKVMGTVGRVWTLLWVVGWGNVLVDAWLRKGLGASKFFPDGLRPVEIFWNTLRFVGESGGLAIGIWEGSTVKVDFAS